MRYISTGSGLVSDAGYRALASFRYALRRFLRFSEAAAAAVGLTPQQHQALLAVRGWPGPEPMSVGALAERLQVRHHSAVGLVDRLAGEGLLARRASRQDRRRMELGVTPRAERILARLSSAHLEEVRRLKPQLAGLLEALEH